LSSVKSEQNVTGFQKLIFKSSLSRLTFPLIPRVFWNLDGFQQWPKSQPLLAVFRPQGVEPTKRQGTNEVRGDVLCFFFSIELVHEQAKTLQEKSS
jgi:hypothetical protein